MYDKLKLIFPRLLCVLDGTEDSPDEEENGSDYELSDNNIYCTLQNVQQILCKKSCIIHEFEVCANWEEYNVVCFAKVSMKWKIRCQFSWFSQQVIKEGAVT